MFGHSAAITMGDPRGHRHHGFLRRLKLGKVLKRAAGFFPGSGFAMGMDLLGDPVSKKGRSIKAHLKKASHHKTAHKAAHGGAGQAIAHALGAGVSAVAGGIGEIDPSDPMGSMMHMATHPAHQGALHLGGGRRRRINWANPRALGRAERRLHSFIKHFTKTARFLGMHVGRAPRRSRKGAFGRKR